MKNVFIADLRGVKLTDDQVYRIEAAIQGAVLAELGAVAQAGGRQEINRALHRPREWLGIWIDDHGAFSHMGVDDIVRLSK